MEKEELSDESLWRLFEATVVKDQSAQSILNSTQKATDAITNQPSSKVSQPAPLEDNEPGPREEQLEEFTPHVLDTVVEENSKDSQTSHLPTTESPVKNVECSELVEAKGDESQLSRPDSAGPVVKVKVKSLREITSPLGSPVAAGVSATPLATTIPATAMASTSPQSSLTAQNNNQPITAGDVNLQPITSADDSTLSPMVGEFTGAMPGGFYVTVEKHTADGVDRRMTSTPRVIKSEAVKVKDTKTAGGDNSESSSSCQSSFDVPKPEPIRNRKAIKDKSTFPTMRQGRTDAMTSNPQLMAQDVQVRQYDPRQRRQAVEVIAAKQAETRVHRSKYNVPVKTVAGVADFRTGSSAKDPTAQQSGSAPLLASQNITVQHELVASGVVSSLLERLVGKTPSEQVESGAELKEIRALESKLECTEHELRAVKEQMTSQHREDQNKLLSELVYSQRNLQNQLQNLGTKAIVGEMHPTRGELLKTPAPRAKLPTATVQESPDGGFMEQVVRSYPSPVSPSKHAAEERQLRDCSPRTRLSPEPILKNSPNRLTPSRGEGHRKVRVELETEKQIKQLNEKVQKLLDEKRLDSLQMETALKKQAPIDRYLEDIQLVRDKRHSPPTLPSLLSDQGKKQSDLDVTFLMPDEEVRETTSFTDQMKKKLDRLRQRQQQSEENIATVLAMREREHNFLTTHDCDNDEDSRLEKLVQAHLARAEADVQKQVSQVDFLPKPLHDLNIPSNQAPAKYRTAAQRLKAVQAKIDTGIARKPRVAVDKENEMEPIDLTRDDNYIKRVYGKALYHAQRRTVEKVKPDSPTRPIPFKSASEKRVRSEKVQVGERRAGRVKGSQVKPAMTSKVKPVQTKMSSAPSVKAGSKAKRTVAAAISEPVQFTPTTVLGSGMRIGYEDPTTMVLEVQRLPPPPPDSPDTSESVTEAKASSKDPQASKSAKDTADGRLSKPLAVTVDRVESPFTNPSERSESRASNRNNNARSSGSAASKEGNSDSPVTSEWPESGDDSTRPPLMMTADSLDLSAVTPATDSQRSNEGRNRGQAHSTPVEHSSVSADEQPKGQKKSVRVRASADPPPRAWEEFEENLDPRLSTTEDKSRSDDIITPPTTLPGYQYSKAVNAPAAEVLQTPLARPKDLYSGGDRQQEVRGATRYPRVQWAVDPVVEKPLYDPTEMAARDWLEEKLMAKCLERMVREYPVRKPAADPTSRTRGDNPPLDSPDNTLVAGILGEGGGAQVFVDAGRPINTDLVKQLMKECLVDKIRSLLSGGEMDRTPGDVTKPSGQSAAAVGVAVQSDGVDRQTHPFTQAPVVQVKTPERTPPASPVEVVTKYIARTPQPSPPTSPTITDAVSKPLELSLRRSTEKRSDSRLSTNRMPATPFDLQRQRSLPMEEDEVRIEQEVVPPTPAVDTADGGDVVKSQDEKLHLSQVSLWDTLSAAPTQDSVLDEEPPFEMRYSIDTPEPTPPPSPPQAVSVQTSLTEQVIEAKLRGLENGDNNSRQQTPVPATRASRPTTPLRTSTQPDLQPTSPSQSQVIRVAANQSQVIQVTPSQSQAIQVAPSQSHHDSPPSTSTVTDTQMRTVSEGEWILKSDGQITPRGEATLADLSLASSSDEEVNVRPQRREEVNGDEDDVQSEGEIIGPANTDPLVALLAKVKDTPKALKSWKRDVSEEGQHIITSPQTRSDRNGTGVDNSLRLSDLQQSSKVKRQLIAGDNQSSSSSAGIGFADSKQVTVRPRETQEVVREASASPVQPMREQVIVKPAYGVSPNKPGRGGAKRAIPGMIQSTLEGNRKSRPTSSLRTTEDFSQFSNTSGNLSRTRESVDSPDRMHTESILRSGGYLTRTHGDTTSDISEQRRAESTSLDTQQLLARTIDTQGLSTGTLMDTNKLLADTAEQQDLYQQHLQRQQRSMTLRSDIINEAPETYSYNVNESVDSVSSGGILRSSNEYTRTLSGAANKPRQYLRFSVPTGDEDSSQPSDDVSELDF